MIFRRKRDIEEQYADYYADDRDRESGRRRRAPAWIHLGVWVVGVAALLITVRVVAGQTMLEKLVQALIAPVGMVWLLLLLITYIAAFSRAKFAAAVALAAWLLLTIAGNSVVANLLAQTVESPYYDFKIEEAKKFDVVVLLGGGTNLAANDQPQLAAAGDRLAMVARLFHAGKVDRIICTGTSWQPNSAREPEVAEQAMILLQQMGVPNESITMLTGQNTFQEIQSLDRWLGEQKEKPERIGIVSSAWHLPRVSRLANTVGIDAAPIPANFYSRSIKPNPGFIVPGESNLMIVQAIGKEYLAALVGR